MTHLLSSALAVGLLAMAAFPGLAAPSPGDPLAPYLWKSRLLVVLAPDATDPKLAKQREIFAAFKSGARERDLSLVEAIGDEPRAVALRAKFGLSDGEFRVLLVGKDGGDKLSSNEPLDRDDLFPLIDSMPMRQDEMMKK